MPICSFKKNFANIDIKKTNLILDTDLQWNQNKLEIKPVFLRNDKDVVYASNWTDPRRNFQFNNSNVLFKSAINDKKAWKLDHDINTGGNYFKIIPYGSVSTPALSHVDREFKINLISYLSEFSIINIFIFHKFIFSSLHFDTTNQHLDLALQYFLHYQKLIQFLFGENILLRKFDLL